MTLKQRNYAVCTWDPSIGPNHREERVPSCFAFFGIRSSAEAAAELGEKLDIVPRPWMINGHWCVAWDYVVGQGIDPFKEVAAKVWEMRQLGITFEWITDPVPEMPAELTQRTNCFESFEGAMKALAGISPSTNPDHFST